MMEMIDRLWFKRRDLVSDGYDEALDYISKRIPLKIHRFPTGKRCWTWTIPEKWSVKEAFIEDPGGKRLVDIKDHPLHVISYSLPVDRTVGPSELLKHLHTAPERPDAIPFEFKYYERDWGFCVQHSRLKEFTKSSYRVRIDSKFEKGFLKVGDCTVAGKTDKTVVLIAHLCHPAMVNDDMTGVAVLADIAARMAARKNFYTYKFLIVPETIGSIAYLSGNEDIIPALRYGIFLEMCGNDNAVTLQTSKEGNTKIDRIARHAMKRRFGAFREGPFRKVVGNDELVFNGPGVGVPTISLSRYPYPEYHTSDDNMSIISGGRLAEYRDLVMDILYILDNDYIPKRRFKGPVFLSGYGLWVDWRIDKNLNSAIEDIMLNMEGGRSVFDIADSLGLGFAEALEYINRFREKKLISVKPAA